MAIKCVAIEKDESAVQLIKSYIEETPSLQLVQVFTDAGIAVDFLRTHHVDLLIANLQMRDIAKVELVESKPMIIFTTSHNRNSFEGFELQVVDYLIQPVGFDVFTKAVAKAEAYYKFKNTLTEQDEYLYVYADYKLVRLPISEIEFIESLEDYVRIHMSDEKPVLSLMPLKRVLQKLPAGKFQRVHRSYIVSVSKVTGIQNRRVILSSAQVPVSDSYWDAVRKMKKF